MAFQQLLLGSFDEEELNVPIDGFATIRGADTEQCTPLLIWLEVVADDLDWVLS